MREREAARWTIALINDCAVCRDTRARDGEAAGADEGFYAEVARWRTSAELSASRAPGRRVRRALRRRPPGHGRRAVGPPAQAFGDDELADLTMCCGMFLGMGRTLAVIGVRAPDERILV